MKVPLSWLKEYVDITVLPEELAYTLTMAGLEVEAIEYIGADWGDKIITAQIVHLEKVPGSDHLTYARVITGKEEPGEELGIICGAPNIRQGDKVPLALVGARIGDSRRPRSVPALYCPYHQRCENRSIAGMDRAASPGGRYAADQQRCRCYQLCDVGVRSAAAWFRL